MATTPGPSVPALTAEDGRTLVEKLECGRCHEGTGLTAVPREKHCLQCHEEIIRGTFEAEPTVLASWRPHVAHLRHAPALGGIGTIVTTTWAAQYLLRPTDLRPSLHPTMPRLPLDAREAEAIVLHLANLNRAKALEPSKPTEVGDIARGRVLFTSKGCGGCHVFTGARMTPPPAPSPKDGPDRTLAPDLRFARERLDRERVVAWILDPASQKPDAAMPKQNLTRAEASDLAELLWSAPLDPAPTPPPWRRLAVLTRDVTYDEVARRVLHKICWHCHSEPDYARGDGGPGNTGGFGFAPRKLDLSSYESIAAGYLDARGERVSVFAAGPSGEPALLAAVLARHDEERGAYGPIRGMPLGLPGLSAEDVQLLETWIAQGHPR